MEATSELTVHTQECLPTIYGSNIKNRRNCKTVVSQKGAKF